jgi:hypothetical protein
MFGAAPFEVIGGVAGWLLKFDGRVGVYGLLLWDDVEFRGGPFVAGDVELFSGASGGGALLGVLFVAAGCPVAPS